MSYLSIWQFVRLFERRRRCRRLHFLVKVERCVAQLLLDVAHNFALGGGGERVAALGQDLHQVVGEIAAGNVEPQARVRQHVTFVARHGPRHTVADRQHHAGGSARGVERSKRRRGHRAGGNVERFEENLQRRSDGAR